MKQCSNKTFEKKVFFFTSNDRALLDVIGIGERTSICVKNESGEIVMISFIVTRNAYLGKNSHWIYGEVVNPPEGGYHQIELKLHEDNHSLDTIEVFKKAPPIKTNSALI